MTRIVGIPGALRRGSFNRALLRAAIEVAPAGTTIEPGEIRGIPPYDGDLEDALRDAGGFPPEVLALRAQVDAADALLLVSPEYNQSVPGVLKNALDWLSREGPAKEDVCRGKPVALIGATPGLGGTRLAQTAWLPVFRALGLKPWFGRQLYVAGAGKVFDGEGRMVDDKVRALLTTFIAEYAAEVARR
jgi:NAD(P)H-dependent FMN reductase